MKIIDKINAVSDFFYGISDFDKDTTLQDIRHALEDGEFLAECFPDEEEHIEIVEEIYGYVEDLISQYGKDYPWLKLVKRFTEKVNSDTKAMEENEDLFDMSEEIISFCKKNHIKVDIRKFKGKVYLAFDDFSYDEMSEIRKTICQYGKILEDDYLAGNGRSIVVKL